MISEGFVTTQNNPIQCSIYKYIHLLLKNRYCVFINLCALCSYVVRFDKANCPYGDKTEAHFYFSLLLNSYKSTKHSYLRIYNWLYVTDIFHYK